jgi:hypothetical protein
VRGCTGWSRPAWARCRRPDRSKFEQQLGHFEIVSQDGHVHRPHFAAAQVHDFRAARGHLPSSLEIAAFDGRV